MNWRVFWLVLAAVWGGNTAHHMHMNQNWAGVFSLLMLTFCAKKYDEEMIKHVESI